MHVVWISVQIEGKAENCIPKSTEVTNPLDGEYLNAFPCNKEIISIKTDFHSRNSW